MGTSCLKIQEGVIGSSSDSPVTLLTSSSHAGSSAVKRPGLRGPLLGVVTAALARSVADNSQNNRRIENDSKLSGGKDDGCLGFFFISLPVCVLLSHSELYCSIAAHIFLPGATWWIIAQLTA